MPLGWIDFSKSERNKVLSVLDLLSEAGTLDQLGIAPIRDGYANIFFPGTSTIQTRAKYFFIIPYALKDLEYSDETDPNKLSRIFNEIERQCGMILLSNKEDTERIIGSRSLRQNKWVKRTPADIYWAGLRNYGIFTGGNLSLTEYMRASCALKKQRAEVRKLGNRHDNADGEPSDDKDAGGLHQIQFWRIPPIEDDWMNTLSIKLTKTEGDFLKERIIDSYPDSLFSYILENNMAEVLACKGFADLSSMIHVFPDKMQKDYWTALGFSRFIFVLRTLYNIIISDGQNKEAAETWDVIQNELRERADIDLDQIFDRLSVHGNRYLTSFLSKAQSLMRTGDANGLMKEITRREKELKQGRAKTIHPGEMDENTWFGGRDMDFRFTNAQILLADIFESEGMYVKSE